MYVYDDARVNNWPGKRIRNRIKSFSTINESIFNKFSNVEITTKMKKLQSIRVKPQIELKWNSQHSDNKTVVRTDVYFIIANINVCNYNCIFSYVR